MNVGKIVRAVGWCAFWGIAYFVMPESFAGEAANGKVSGWTISRELSEQKIDVVEMDGSPCVQMETVKPTKQPGMLSRQFAVKPNRKYVFTVYLKRDSFVFGTSVSVNVPQADGESRINEKSFRSEHWEPISIPFESGSGTVATANIIIPNIGVRRITMGRKLWVRDASLSEIDTSKNLVFKGLTSGENRLTVDIPVTAPYYVWAHVYLPGDNHFSLQCGGEQRTFRGYTLGQWYWVRPVLPDFILKTGKRELVFTVDGNGAKVDELLLTADQFFRPSGATELLPPRPGGLPGNIPAVKVEQAEISLGPDRELPPGQWGISQGVPFPKGALPEAANARIADRPFQAQSLSRWSDGSVRWLLVSTLVSNGEKLRLEYGTEVKNVHPSTTALRVDKRPDGGCSIVTGKIRFDIVPDPNALIRFADGNAVTVLWKNAALAKTPAITVEETGPVRAVVKITGTCDGSFGYIMRCTAYAGAETIELEHQLVNYGLKAMDAQDCGLRINGTFKQAHFMPSDQEVIRPVPAEMSTLVRAAGKDANTFPFSITSPGQKPVSGKRARGLVRLDSGLLIAVRDFWRNSPGEIKVEADRAVVNLYPRKIVFDSGMSRTRRLLIGKSANNAPADVFLAHPLLLASPEWYCDSRAFFAWPLSVGAANAPLYENSVRRTIDFWVQREEVVMKKPFYENMLFCGEFPNGPTSCNNLETALGEGVMTQFFRSGRRDYFDFAERIISHFADVDISHTNGEFKGRILVHGPFIRKKMRHTANGHSWYGGASLYGLFAGDRSILDMARAVGQYHARMIPPQEPKTFIHYWRQPAWQLMAILHAWTVCGDNELLPAARRLVELTRCQQDHIVTLWPYMFAVGMRSIRMYYEITGDPTVRELYLQLADAYMYLRQRPEDTSFGEPAKSPGMLLGNYPNDRSCCFFNVAANADWLADRTEYVPVAATDMDLQLQYGISDPTFLWGSADLLRAMRQDKLELADRGAMTPTVQMNAFGAVTPEGKLPFPATVFQVNDVEDRAFSLTLYSMPEPAYKYSHKADCVARLYAPDGKLLKTDSFTTHGMNQYKFDVPADGQRGIYTLVVVLKNPWHWTLDYLPLQLTAGRHVLEVEPRFNQVALDRFCFAPAGKFDPNSAANIMIEAESAPLPQGYVREDNRYASGTAAVRKAGAKRPLVYEFKVPKTGTYLFRAGIYRGATKNSLEISVDGSPKIDCGQTHDMAANPYTCWMLGSSLGADSIIPTWKESASPYETFPVPGAENFDSSPAFAHAAKDF